MSKAFIFVGATGTGKTTDVKKSILDKVGKDNLFIFDVNNEYNAYYSKTLLPFDTFAETATQIRNGVILFEEATIFLSNRGSNEYLRDILVRKRHAKNIIVLVFHSFRSIPRYIFDLCNYVVIHKTNDNPDLIEQKFNHSGLTALFKEVAASPNKYEKRTYQIS
jgi:DNA helicase HerA-like ATPase